MAARDRDPHSRERDIGGPERPTLAHFLQTGTFTDGSSPNSPDITARKLAMYKQAMENLEATGRFVSMHGGGIDHTAGWGSNQPSAFQVPPGQIVVLIAPRGTVVYGNEQQDTANWLFFKQYLWPIAGTVGGETAANCYGTNPYPSSTETDAKRSNQYGENAKTDKAEVAVLVSAKQEGETVAKRVKRGHVVLEQNKKAVAKKDDELREENVEKEQRKVGGVGELDWNSFQDDPFRTPGANPKVNADGKELLWHMQIFYGGDAAKYGKPEYDGDWVYNQWQLFEMESKPGEFDAVTIDEDFNNYRMGNPLCHMKEAFDSGEFPIGASLPLLDGQPHYHIPTTKNMVAVDDVEQAHANELYGAADSDESFYLKTPYRRGKDGKFYKYAHPFQHANFIAPEFNNKSPNITKAANEANNPWGTAGVHRNIHTTEHIIKKYYKEVGPGITFFSSCSPHKGTEKRIGKTSKTALPNMANLTLRKHLYNLGTGNYCSLRGGLLNLATRAQWQPGCSATLPQYDQHKGITKMAKDDREEFYITVGNFLKAIQVDSIIFTHGDFDTLYFEAKQSAPGGELMPWFKKTYDRWYSAAFITRGPPNIKGKRWNSTPSIESQGLLPFEEEINYIETNDTDVITAWWASADGIAKTAEMEQIKATMNQGGGRKRRRKTKRRRKKKRKSRRKRKTRRRRKKRKTRRRK